MIIHVHFRYSGSTVANSSWSLHDASLLHAPMALPARQLLPSWALLQRVASAASFNALRAGAAGAAGARACQVREKHYSRDIPRHTPRHELDDGSLFIHRHAPQRATLPDGSPMPLPPALKTRWEKFPHDTRLTKDQVAELRVLRYSDPDQWTAKALAEKFQVPPTVVMQLAPLHPLSDRRTKLRDEEDERFERLRLTKKVTIVDRIRRKARW